MNHEGFQTTIVWFLIFFFGSIPFLTIFVLFIYPEIKDQIPYPELQVTIEAIREWILAI